MGMQYVDEAGSQHHPLMGCYGIGVGRLAASVCEEHHDDNGPIWPLSIAPWQLHLCAVRADQSAVKEAAEALYSALLKNGIEVLYDDRIVSAGVMFSDADLLGIPFRAILSPRNLKDGCCEIISRDKAVSIREPLENAAQKIAELIRKEQGNE